ncbi:hypothetical protein EJ110_NYTH09900 [Nymphaea thermarum]|nr:hypothetical protein EJ110_NYTH09900 [Nymphaea thermarum]
MPPSNFTRNPIKKKSLSVTLISLLKSRLCKFLLPLFLFVVIIAFHSSNPSFIARKLQNPDWQCNAIGENLGFLPPGEKYLWFAPHSGFSNQVSELKNALLMAGILNRTLIVPPVLNHHAVALGSCPKFRVENPVDLRFAVWESIVQMIHSRRYISIADIVDLSSLKSSSSVRMIDFRVFAQLWCGIDVKLACTGSLCCGISTGRSSWSSFEQCGSLLSGLGRDVVDCVYGVDEDCRTTVWTYQNNVEEILDSFQPSKELQAKKKFSYVRKKKDVYKALGPGSKAASATVLSFGSVFSAPYKGSELYIDIHAAPRDGRIQSLLGQIQFLPFTPEIVRAGKSYAANTIKSPFLCTQLRLLDGQFKNHWNVTFAALQEKIQMLKNDSNSRRDGIHIFVMTDLPPANWTGTYLGDLTNDVKSYKLYSLHEEDELVVQTGKKVLAAEHGIRSGFLPKMHDTPRRDNDCSSKTIPDILLYIEETICSCASLGFVGTAGSTIAENIELMRKNNVCFNSNE